METTANTAMKFIDKVGLQNRQNDCIKLIKWNHESWNLYVKKFLKGKRGENEIGGEPRAEADDGQVPVQARIGHQAKSYCAYVWR